MDGLLGTATATQPPSSSSNGKRQAPPPPSQQTSLSNATSSRQSHLNGWAQFVEQQEEAQNKTCSDKISKLQSCTSRASSSSSSVSPQQDGAHNSGEMPMQPFKQIRQHQLVHHHNNGFRDNGFPGVLAPKHVNMPSHQRNFNGHPQHSAQPPPPPSGPAPSLSNGSGVIVTRQRLNGHGHHHHHVLNGVHHHLHHQKILMRNGRVDLSQGSCDTTPATPDSLAASSLVCSAEEEDHSTTSAAVSNCQFLLQQQHNMQVILPQQPFHATTVQRVFLPSTTPPFSLNSTMSPSPGMGCLNNNNNNSISQNCDYFPDNIQSGDVNGSVTSSLSDHWRASNGNLSCQMQRDNMIEEVTTPVPRAEAGENGGTDVAAATPLTSGATSPVSSTGNAPASSATSPGSVSPPQSSSSRRVPNGDGLNGDNNNGGAGSTLQRVVRRKDFSSSTLERDLANLKQYAESSSKASEVVKDMLSATGTMKRRQCNGQQLQGQKIYESLYPQMVPPKPVPILTSTDLPIKKTPSHERLSPSVSCSTQQAMAGRRKKHLSTTEYTLMKDRHSHRRRQSHEQPQSQHQTSFATLQRPLRSRRRDEQSIVNGGSLTKQQASFIEAEGVQVQRLFNSYSQDQLPLCDLRRLPDASAGDRANDEDLYSPLNVKLRSPKVSRSSGDLLQLMPPSRRAKQDDTIAADSSSDDDSYLRKNRTVVTSALVTRDPISAGSSASQPKRVPFTIEGAMSALKRRASLTGRRGSSDNGSDKEKSKQRKRLWWGTGGNNNNRSSLTVEPPSPLSSTATSHKEDESSRQNNRHRDTRSWANSVRQFEDIDESASKLNSLLSSRLGQDNGNDAITRLDEIRIEDSEQMRLHPQTSDCNPLREGMVQRSPPPLPPRTVESRNKPPTMRQPPRLPSAFPGATDEDEDDDEEEDCDDGARRRRRLRKRKEQRTSKSDTGKKASKKKGKRRTGKGGDQDDSDIAMRAEDEDDDGGEPHDMEYCDPCYCYGKCCLDVVASIFCVSLL